MSVTEPEGSGPIAPLDPPPIPGPALGEPTYTDRVRFQLALALLAAVACFVSLLLGTVSAGILTVADA
jgi:hypothetical protein